MKHTKYARCILSLQGVRAPRRSLIYPHPFENPKKQFVPLNGNKAHNHKTLGNKNSIDNIGTSQRTSFTTQHRISIIYFFPFARYTASMPEIFKKARAMGSTCEASAFRKVRRAHMKYELTTICKIPYLTKRGYE